jgi:hypothetical protein
MRKQLTTLMIVLGFAAAAIAQDKTLVSHRLETDQRWGLVLWRPAG